MTAEKGWTRPPIAVVALGDVTRRDDGVALRVMGRVRTLVGQIGMARTRRLALTGRTSQDSDPAVQTGQRAQTATEAGTRGSIVEWIEGGTDPQKLDPYLADRRRVVLLDAVRVTGRPGRVHHWHLEVDRETRLSKVRHYNGRPRMGMQHLALWLEDELPVRGTDLIGIEPYDVADGEGLSRALRRQLPAICAQVAALAVQILEEEGW
jgi:hydrogenase maturation protease